MVLSFQLFLKILVESNRFHYALLLVGICGTVPFLPGYYWQLKEKKKGILGAVRFLFNFHFLYSFSLLKSCIHFLFPTQFLFGTDFGLVFVFLKSLYFLKKLRVTYHPLEMFRLLHQTQPQPLIFIIQKFDA